MDFGSGVARGVEAHGEFDARKRLEPRLHRIVENEHIIGSNCIKAVLFVQRVLQNKDIFVVCDLLSPGAQARAGSWAGRVGAGRVISAGTV